MFIVNKACYCVTGLHNLTPTGANTIRRRWLAVTRLYTKRPTTSNVCSLAGGTLVAFCLATLEFGDSKVREEEEGKVVDRRPHPGTPNHQSQMFTTP